MSAPAEEAGPRSLQANKIASRVVSQDDGNGESTNSVGATVSLSGVDGESLTSSETATTAETQKMYFDWTPPSDFAGGTVYLGCVDCDDAFSDVAIELGADEDWDGDNEDVSDTSLTARAWRRGDGTYRFRLKGKPADIASMSFDADGSTPGASLTVDDDLSDYQFTREVWRTVHEFPSDTPDQVVIMEATAYDDGVAIGTMTSTAVPDGVEAEQREGIVIERVKLTENGAGNLKLRADVFSDDITATPTLNVTADDASGDALLTLEDEAPDHSEFQFATDLELVETDNFVDMAYIVNVSLLDAEGTEVGNFDITHVVSDVAHGDDPYAAESVTGTEGDWDYAVMLGFDGVNDVGTARVTVAGPDLASVASMTLTFEPDDGGTDVDPDEVDASFVGAWHVWTQAGDAGSGGITDGESVYFDSTVAAFGDFTAPIGEIDLSGGSSNTPGAVFITAGFGKGTKKLLAPTSSRPELQ